MNDAQTTILYTLSTLAQTCAALAAFVGAVGIFRLQSLTTRQRDMYDDLIVAFRAPDRMTRQEFLDRARQYNEPRVQEPVRAFDRLQYYFRSSRKGLIVFEGWNLLVIGISLVGFNHVQWLAASPTFTFWALWTAALGTVGVTGYCVYVCTPGRGDEHRPSPSPPTAFYLHRRRGGELDGGVAGSYSRAA